MRWISKDHLEMDNLSIKKKSLKVNRISHYQEIVVILDIIQHRYILMTKYQFKNHNFDYQQPSPSIQMDEIIPEENKIIQIFIKNSEFIIIPKL